MKLSTADALDKLPKEVRERVWSHQRSCKRCVSTGGCKVPDEIVDWELKQREEPRYYRNLVRWAFTEKMARELWANRGKGDWKQWKPDADSAAKELAWHCNKLLSAMERGDRERISEFAADVANYCMKIDEVLGVQEEKKKA